MSEKADTNWKNVRELWELQGDERRSLADIEKIIRGRLSEEEATTFLWTLNTLLDDVYMEGHEVGWTEGQSAEDDY